VKSYLESDDDEIVRPSKTSSSRGRTQKRRRTVVDSGDEDDFKADDDWGYSDDGCDTPSTANMVWESQLIVYRFGRLHCPRRF
jgi:hypothetical protein